MAEFCCINQAGLKTGAIFFRLLIVNAGTSVMITLHSYFLEALIKTLFFQKYILVWQCS